MRLITVTALKAFDYRGQKVADGESFEVRPVEALSLRYRRKVRLQTDRRTIERRDLTAEDETPATPKRAKRQYRRRDMTPEPE